MKMLFPPILSLLLLAQDAFGFVITGVSGGVNNSTGARPVRQEIHSMQANNPLQYDLYMQAMSRFQADNQSDMFSWYGITGIHGFPQQPWDGVAGTGPGVGYCFHGSVLFPTWHRTYMALFEQIMWDYVQLIAASYPGSNKAQYQAAALTFRVPYWDWSTEYAEPRQTYVYNVNVNTPTGMVQMPNPLYNYTFHPLVPSDFDGYLTQYKATVRNPNSQGVSQPTASNVQLNKNGDWVGESIYDILVYENNYNNMSNTNAHGPNSLENMHNYIHATVGNGGHMAFIPLSSFDPIFWLHHANVDRLLAIWQALHPNSFTQPQADPGGTYIVPANTVEDANFALYPFHRDSSGNFWNSNAVRSTRTFGYSYPEIVDWNVSPQQLTSNVLAAVDKLYAPVLNNKKRDASGQHIGQDKSETQWIIEVESNRAILTQSVTLNLFFAGSANLIANYPVVVIPQSHDKGLVRGTIPLTKVLKSLSSSNPALFRSVDWSDTDSVVKGFAERLSWDVVSLDSNSPVTLAAGALNLKLARREIESASGDGELPTAKVIWRSAAKMLTGSSGSVW